METNLKKEQIYTNHFAIHLKLTQYYKSTKFQFLKKVKSLKKSKKQIPSAFLSNKIKQIRELLKNLCMSKTLCHVPPLLVGSQMSSAVIGHTEDRLYPQGLAL